LYDLPFAACPIVIGIVKREKYLAGKITGDQGSTLCEKEIFFDE
jgi:hypothetical protein